MGRHARIALSISIIVAVAIVVGGLTPREFGQGPIRRDGPLLHGVAFALLVLPLTFVWSRRWVAILLSAIVFGGIIEGLQEIVGRAPEWSDLAANALGALLGALAGLALSRRAARHP